VRVNFNYFISQAVFAYILDAVDLVATDGWKLLPQYRFEEATGLWTHVGGVVEPPLSLRDIRYENGRLRHPSHGRRQEPETSLARYLEEARAIVDQPPPVPAGTPRHDLSADFEALRWFWLPEEVTAAARA
jgi:hypothetical protein